MAAQYRARPPLVIDSRRPWHIPSVMAKPFVVSALLLATLACEARQADGELVGRSCEIQNEAATCDDGKVAFCGPLEYDPWVVDAELEYGPCLSEEELECEPGEVVSMGDYELCGELFKRCIAVGGIPTWIEDGCDTPLVLRFDDQPITMIPAESTPMASFDISMRADSCIMTDWPEATTPWLALDVDGSGAIEGGHELFGSGSRLADGAHAEHGFMALAALDHDHSGSIDAADPHFAELMLWRDYDADRRSQPSELEPLASMGITSLPTAYVSAIECDARGNCANQRAAFAHTGGVGELVDVYLSCH